MLKLGFSLFHENYHVHSNIFSEEAVKKSEFKNLANLFISKIYFQVIFKLKFDLQGKRFNYYKMKKVVAKHFKRKLSDYFTRGIQLLRN